MQPFIWCLLALIVFANAVSGVIQGNTILDDHRIIIVGDVHGDRDNFLRALQLGSIVDATDRSSPGEGVRWSPHTPDLASDEHEGLSRRHAVRTTVVQMGDLVDRGEDDLGALNIALDLYEQSRTSTRHDVVLLLGNHEAMNLVGQFHYVNEKDYGGFLTRQLRAGAFSKDGAYGSAILRHFRAIYVDERTVFVHAGFARGAALRAVETMNDDIRDALMQRDLRSSALSSSGILWTRSMIRDAMLGECADLPRVLQYYGADRIIVGHTPQFTGRIGVYCEGQLIAVDVGLSRWVLNHVAALEMRVQRWRVAGQDTTVQEMTTLRELREGAPTATTLHVSHRTYEMSSDTRPSGCAAASPFACFDDMTCKTPTAVTA